VFVYFIFVWVFIICALLGMILVGGDIDVSTYRRRYIYVPAALPTKIESVNYGEEANPSFSSVVTTLLNCNECKDFVCRRIAFVYF
jgi:hypothetical protein